MKDEQLKARAEAVLSDGEYTPKVCKNERDVKNEVKCILGLYGDNVWWYMPVQTGYGVSGIPDFIVCLNGKFIGIETKYGRGELTPFQQKQTTDIANAQGYAFVINERALLSLKSALDRIHWLP